MHEAGVSAPENGLVLPVCTYVVEMGGEMGSGKWGGGWKVGNLERKLGKKWCVGEDVD